MKTLTLVRHAKSSWDDPDLRDHDRPLGERGLRDAPAMGKRLHDEGLAPDVILTSSAVRARATAEAIAIELGYDPAAIVVEETLYAAWPRTILDVVAAQDDSATSVMIVGHDPGMSDLVAEFDSAIDRMPTCAVAEFGFDVDRWADVPGAQAHSTYFRRP